MARRRHRDQVGHRPRTRIRHPLHTAAALSTHPRQLKRASLLPTRRRRGGRPSRHLFTRQCPGRSRPHRWMKIALRTQAFSRFASPRFAARRFASERRANARLARIRSAPSRFARQGGRLGGAVVGGLTCSAASAAMRDEAPAIPGADSQLGFGAETTAGRPQQPSCPRPATCSLAGHASFSPRADARLTPTHTAGFRLYEGGRVVKWGWRLVVRGRGRVVGVERCSCLYRPVGLRGLGEIGAARPAVHVQNEPSSG